MLSAAHYTTAVYAALCEVGRLPSSALEQFGEDGSRMEMIGGELSPGVESTSGSLGQTVSVGIGRAIARRARGSTGRIWVLISDGELQEGQTWEALQVAAHHGLGNLTVILDANGLQVDGPMSAIVDVEPIAEKVRAFGWSVAEIDGHDLPSIDRALAETAQDRPRFVIARTTPWQGIPSLQARYPNSLHFIRFREGEAAAALEDLHLTSIVA
jgi:transketolase